MRRASYETVASWVNDAWREVTTVTITNGFRRAGLVQMPITASGNQQQQQQLNFEPLDAINAESDEDEDDDMGRRGNVLTPEMARLFQSDSELSDFDGFPDEATDD